MTDYYIYRAQTCFEQWLTATASKHEMRAPFSAKGIRG